MGNGVVLKMKISLLSETFGNKPCDLINNNTTTDIQSIEDYSITSKATALLVLSEEIKEGIIN